MRSMSVMLALALVGCSGGDSLSNGQPDLADPSGGGGGGVDLAQGGGSPDLAGGAMGGGVGPYDVAGPASVTKVSRTVKSGFGGWGVDVYVPSTAGAHPVVILSSGLQQPAAAYVSYAQRLASWGVVTVLRDDPGITTSSSTVASDLTMLVTTFLPAENQSGPLAGTMDLAKLGLAGHSRGGQASLLALEGGLKGKAKGFVGLDPVDGTPSAATSLGTIAIPSLFMGETTNSQGTMACAPAARNYAVLYAAAPSPSVELTFVGADHTQFEDPAGCFFCNLCQPAGTANGATVLGMAVRYTTAFFARELLADASVGATLDGAGVAVDVAANRITRDSK